MMTTINIKFNPADLPDWAQHDAEVLKRCRNDLAFRASVCAAQTQQARNHLRSDTYRLRDERDRI